MHRENRENGQNNSLSGKHREFGNFVKTQGIWVAQTVNSLIPKVKDISLFAAKIPQNNLKLDISTSQFGVRNSHKSHKLAQGKFAVRRGKNKENTGNLKMKFKWVP